MLLEDSHGPEVPGLCNSSISMCWDTISNAEDACVTCANLSPKSYLWLYFMQFQFF